MNRMRTIVMLGALALPSLCLAAEWKDVPIVDVNCSAKVKDNPDAHTRNCALQCSKSGYGIIAAGGKFLKFDAKGNQEALAAIQASKSTDHLRATVTGKLQGDTIQVQSLKM